MTRTEHSLQTCAWLLRNLVHLHRTDALPTKDDVIGSLLQCADDLAERTEGMVALHKLASDQAREGTQWPSPDSGN